MSRLHRSKLSVGRVRLMGNAVDKLRYAIENEQVIFVIGSGVSAALTNQAPTSTWIGLIESGIKYSRRMNPNLKDDWEKLVRDTISYGQINSDPDSLIVAAGHISKALRGISEQTFANWLSESIGELKAENPALAEALLKFRIPILTTNYDNMLSTVGGIPAVTWRDHKKMHDIITSKLRGIGHLHGLWDEVESVVLSESDYVRLIESEPAQTLQHSASVIKGIIYIGFGEGINDPKFKNLRSWFKSLFSVTNHSHFRLCLENEKQLLEQFHNSEKMEIVPYGSSYEDLITFLDDILPKTKKITLNESGLQRNLISEIFEALEEKLKSELITTEIVGDERRALNSLILDPVLLPVPHAEYVRLRTSNNQTLDLKKIDIDSEISQGGIILLIGDDGSGLSTSVKWLTLKAARYFQGNLPIIINFKSCTRSTSPLQQEIRHQIISEGY